MDAITGPARDLGHPGIVGFILVMLVFRKGYSAQNQSTPPPGTVGSMRKMRVSFQNVFGSQRALANGINAGFGILGNSIRLNM